MRSQTRFRMLLLGLLGILCSVAVLSEIGLYAMDQASDTFGADGGSNEFIPRGIHQDLRQDVIQAAHAKTTAQLEAIAKRYSAPPQELLNLLSDPDWHVFAGAAFVISRMGPRAQSAIPALAQSLKSDNRELRLAAFNALQGIGPSAIPVLSIALKDKNGKDRAVAATALARIGPPALSVLVDEFEDEDRGFAYTVAVACGEMGPSALPTLVGIFTNNQSSEQQRSASAKALARIRPSGFSLLVNVMKDKSQSVKMRVIATRTGRKQVRGCCRGTSPQSGETGGTRKTSHPRGEADRCGGHRSPMR